MKRIYSDSQTNLSTKCAAFPYQAQAFNTIKDLEYAAIFHEQGLGKTKIAVDLIVYWLKKEYVDTVIVVTKKQLVKNWIDEFKIHTYIIPKVLGLDKKENFYILNSPVKVIVTNFETIISEKERIQLFLHTRNVGIIIDESTKLKNPDSQVTRTFFELAPFFNRRIIMSGTPIANRPYDIWAQIFFLDEGKSLGKDFTEFKKNNDLTNKLDKKLEARENFEKNVSSIYKSISSFSVRETKKSCSVNLPNKVYQTAYAEFSPIQRDMYYQVLKSMKIEVEREGEKILDDDHAALKRLIRLLQITSNPKLIDESYKEVSGKEKILKKIISKIISKNEKCIIWSSFIENVDKFYLVYKLYNPGKIHGKMSISDRNKAVDKFKNDETCRLLFATPQAAKEGLTLTVANNVIFYDRSFNLDDYLQAQDRIHRISQKKTCYVYNIIIKNSIDLWIQDLLEAKQQAAFLGQGDITYEDYRKKATYSYCDIIKDILNAGESYYD
jgi:SNF2 family DNA or RNA helicase